MSIGIHHNCVAYYSGAANARDKCSRLHVTDADGVVVEKVTAVADLNIVIARVVHTTDVGTGFVAQGDVIAAPLLARSALKPTAVFSLPFSLLASAETPAAVFSLPVLLPNSARRPLAVL